MFIKRVLGKGGSSGNNHVNTSESSLGSFNDNSSADSQYYASSVPGTIPIPQQKSLPQDPVESVHDRLVQQMCQNDDYIRDCLKLSHQFRSDLEQCSKSAQQFSISLGALSSQLSGIVISSDLNSEDGKSRQQTEEEQKRAMLVAAVHQLAKFYYLMAQHQQQMAVSLMSDFESYVEDRQEKHRDKCKQWASDYQASVVSLLDYIDSMHCMVKDPQITHSDEIRTEISVKQNEVDGKKRGKINQMIKSERHHYVHFTHRLQTAFRTQLTCFKDLYQQNLSDVPDYIDTRSIRSILEKGDRPSQLLLRLRRPSEGGDNEYSYQNRSRSGSKSGRSDDVAYLGKHAADKLSSRAHGGDSGVDVSAAQSHDGRHNQQSSGNSYIQRSKSENQSANDVPGGGDSRLMPNAAGPGVRYTRRVTTAPGVADPRFSVVSMAKIKHLLADKNVDMQKAIVLYDYVGQGEADMSVQRDEVINVISIEGEWAYALRDGGNRKGVNMGWIPLSFTSLCDELC